MNYDLLLELLAKKLIGDQELSASEQEVLEKGLRDTHLEELLGRDMDLHEAFSSLKRLEAMNTRRMDRKLAILRGQQSTSSILRTIRPYLAAASILAIAFGGAWLWKIHGARQTPQIGVAKVATDLAPGGNRATLTLASGATILMDSAANGTIARQGGSQVLKIGSGELAYNKEANSAPVGFNMITTPRGGQYHVVLVDGTNVWLNAGSSLRFPTAFTEGSRVVELTGEGYFEVKHMESHPFKVKVGDREVVDIGTHFDVNAYGDEPVMKTTLLEGSVEIAGLVLHPGQQARIDGDGRVSLLKKVNVDEAVAWKNGLFEFNGADIETVMRALARWYDVDVRYEAQRDAHRFTGQIGRDSKASEVLEVLALSGYHFRIEGRTITVLP